MFTSLKTFALAATVLVGATTSTMAGSVWAWADGEVTVYDKWGNSVDELWDGEKVSVSWCKKGVCWIEHKGDDGLVYKAELDFHKGKKKYWDHDEYEFCIGGKHGSFCISD